MIKKLLPLILIPLTTLSAQAYEDCVIMSDGKLTDINIEDNTLIDVYPLVTVANDKKTLIVHPLKHGNIRFCLLKNNKQLALFEVYVGELETKVNAPDGFEVLTIDPPTDDFEFTLDEPPLIENK